jgi:hypothetical protein
MMADHHQSFKVLLTNHISKDTFLSRKLSNLLENGLQIRVQRLERTVVTSFEEERRLGRPSLTFAARLQF